MTAYGIKRTGPVEMNTVKIQKISTELGPGWYGYEITSVCKPHGWPKAYGWVAPVMNHRTKKWYFSSQRPVRNPDTHEVGMSQFDSEGHDTLRRATQELLLTKHGLIVDGSTTKYHR